MITISLRISGNYYKCVAFLHQVFGVSVALMLEYIHVTQISKWFWKLISMNSFCGTPRRTLVNQGIMAIMFTCHSSGNIFKLWHYLNGFVACPCIPRKADWWYAFLSNFCNYYVPGMILIAVVCHPGFLLMRSITNNIHSAKNVCSNLTLHTTHTHTEPLTLWKKNCFPVRYMPFFSCFFFWCNWLFMWDQHLDHWVVYWITSLVVFGMVFLITFKYFYHLLIRYVLI